MDILDKLRAETRADHDRLEALGLSGKIMDRTLSLGEYKKLILVQYIVHKELEALLEENGVEELFPALEYGERRKMPLLEQDVEELEMKRSEIWAEEPAGKLPHLQKPYGLLGCVYVMEGATLGGMVIMKALKKNDQLSGIDNFYYFGCYGGDTGSRWKNFLEILNEEGNRPDAQEAVVEAAKETFQYFAAAFKKFL